MNARSIIHAEYTRQRTISFQWGVSDCALTAADFALVLTGRDPLARFRGVYDSETGARRHMLANGWRDMGDLAAAHFAEIPLGRARSGDWAHVVNEDGTDTLGVVIGAQIVARGQGGLMTVPLSRANRAFRVE
ncbi:MAG TPA: hypothetical protein VNQ56_12840 [Pseudolabrys sp.]|nr:hypothetical protein [Pseudolabrys sp.]